jgi:hypothetical protein
MTEWSVAMSLQQQNESKPTYVRPVTRICGGYRASDPQRATPAELRWRHRATHLSVLQLPPINRNDRDISLNAVMELS